MFKLKNQRTSDVRENVKGGDKAVTFNHIFSSMETLGKLKLCAVLDFPPGSSIGPHAHEFDAEIYYVLEGELTVVEDGVIKVLISGDAAFTGGGGIHAVANRGNTPAKMLAIIFA